MYGWEWVSDPDAQPAIGKQEHIQIMNLADPYVYAVGRDVPDFNIVHSTFQEAYETMRWHPIPLLQVFKVKVQITDWEVMSG